MLWGLFMLAVFVVTLVCVLGDFERRKRRR
jgi:hypothetical protein